MNYKNVKNLTESLQNDFELTDFEALQIAAQIDKSQTFRSTLECVFGYAPGSPAYLEAIAMALGINDGSIASSLNEIAEALRDLKEDSDD